MNRPGNVILYHLPQILSAMLSSLYMESVMRMQLSSKIPRKPSIPPMINVAPPQPIQLDFNLQNGLRFGHLEIRLARTAKEIRKAQALRYKVFYQEMNARASAKTRLTRRDEDRFDAICDHLLVLDYSTEKPGRTPQIVGTYRLLRQQIAVQNGGFYTQSEFNVTPLLERHKGKQFLELGRSCVLPAFRTSRTMELLWYGIWSYVQHFNIDVLFGCASFPGVEPNANAPALGFLKQHAGADGEWYARALPEHFVDMTTPAQPKQGDTSARHIIKNLPPLIKAYMRLGAKFGDGAVIDHQFGTTDVLVILPVSTIDQKYINYFHTDAHRFAA